MCSNIHSDSSRKVYQQLPDGAAIVEYEETLAQAVADMWNQSGDSWGGDMVVHTGEDVASELKGGAYINVYLAERNGEVLGFASLSKYFGDDKALYLHILNVRPDWHGKKLGKALVLQCVARTLELGYPRLDIHTWPGNIQSVPLYKKCGYMWEDRVDSTHLVNFIPTVLHTEACADFFAEADWYADNARTIEVKPDGVKENGFEMFTYAWQKNGKHLYAGFERTGRQLRLLETDDYRIALTAENHELAFGLDYPCAFEIENKTGRPLSVCIQGRDDGNIHFDYTAEADNITGKQCFEGRFSVGEITEPQDIWRVHPCVSAALLINGQQAVFGLGIETKWPVSLTIEELKKITRPGAVYDAYVNLTSALLSDADVTIRLPEDAAVTRYDLDVKTTTATPTTSLTTASTTTPTTSLTTASTTTLTTSLTTASTTTPTTALTTALPALGKASIKIKARALACGHETLPVVYTVTMVDGRSFSYTRPLHVAARGLTGICAYETETDYILQNGPWQLGLRKNGAYAWTHHVFHFNTQSGPGFPIGQLGRPYSDEFEHGKPFRVITQQQADVVSMEASYRSAAFPDVVYTAVYSLSPGMFTRKHRVVNERGEPITLVLKDMTNAALRLHTVLPYNGGIQTIREGLSACAVAIDSGLIEENWAFEANPRKPMGICWPPDYRVNVRWGDSFFFEHDIALPPGAAFETAPVVIVCGVFTQYQDFRDFARHSYTPAEALSAAPHIDWTLNGGNPFAITRQWTATLDHHRNALLEGMVTVTAEGRTFAESEATAESGRRLFTYTPGGETQDALTPVTLDLKLKNMEKSWRKIIFTPQAARAVTANETVTTKEIVTAKETVTTKEIVTANETVTTKAILTAKDAAAATVSVTEQDGGWTVNNGLLTYKTDPAFSDACYTLSKDGHEWLLSKYPSRAPYSWFNPFIGGLHTALHPMHDAMTIREPISAAEAVEYDALGNGWRGVVTTVSVEQFEEHKGIVYEQYYLTLPGLPVLCYFLRLHNHTGLYKKMKLRTDLFAGHPAGVDHLIISGTSENGIAYRFPVGADSWYRDAGRLITVETKDAIAGDKLYLYRNTEGGAPLTFDIDTNIAILSAGCLAEAENGGTFTTRPLFVILTPLALTAEQLMDVDRVVFK